MNTKNDMGLIFAEGVRFGQKHPGVNFGGNTSEVYEAVQDHRNAFDDALEIIAQVRRDEQKMTLPNLYTEEQLKTAFECGASMAEYAWADEVAFNSTFPEAADDTPWWIHRGNMLLWVWNKVSWDQVRAWILAAGKPETSRDLATLIL
jgi:hypothetical protein